MLNWHKGLWLDTPSHVTIFKPIKVQYFYYDIGSRMEPVNFEQTELAFKFFKETFLVSKAHFFVSVGNDCRLPHWPLPVLIIIRFPEISDSIRYSSTFFSFQLCKSCNRGSPMTTTLAPLMKVNDSCIIKTNFPKLSCVYWRRLMFERSWVWIPATCTWWTWHIFTMICCKNCIVWLKRPKMNEKEAGVGSLKKLFKASN